ARRNDPARRARRLISQLETLGYTITAKPPTTTQRAHEPAWSRRFLFRGRFRSVETLSACQLVSRRRMSSRA
ncbi:MAG TPA: hypothetical protein VK735_11175, partial [Pseudonocardia sp.]|uniref:hypothetical protein n=1 Tax=Pseudonocardia sp. TaxID=60912 RepID=UPI002BE733F2